MDPKLEKIRDQWLKRTYAVAKNQARYQGVEFTLTWEKYRDLWCENDNFLRKGRGRDDLCLSRIDYDGPWSDANVEIKTRWTVLIDEGKRRRKVI